MSDSVGQKRSDSPPLEYYPVQYVQQYKDKVYEMSLELAQSRNNEQELARANEEIRQLRMEVNMLKCKLEAKEASDQWEISLLRNQATKGYMGMNPDSRLPTTSKALAIMPSPKMGLSLKPMSPTKRVNVIPESIINGSSSVVNSVAVSRAGNMSNVDSGVSHVTFGSIQDWVNSDVEIADPGEKENTHSPLEKPRDAAANFAIPPSRVDLPASPVDKSTLSPDAPLQEPSQADENSQALSPEIESGSSGEVTKKSSVQVPIKIPKKLNKAIYPQITKLGLPKPSRPIFKKKHHLTPEEWHTKPYSPPKARALPTIIDETNPKAETKPFSRVRCRFIKFPEDHTTRKTKRKLKARQQRMYSKITEEQSSQELDEKMASLDKDLKDCRYTDLIQKDS